MNEPAPPRPARFQFGLGGLLGWVLWLGFCVATAIGIGIPLRYVGIVGLCYGGFLLFLLVSHVLDRDQERHSDER